MRTNIITKREIIRLAILSVILIALFILSFSLKPKKLEYWKVNSNCKIENLSGAQTSEARWITFTTSGECTITVKEVKVPIQ